MKSITKFVLESVTDTVGDAAQNAVRKNVGITDVIKAKPVQAAGAAAIGGAAIGNLHAKANSPR